MKKHLLIWGILLFLNSSLQAVEPTVLHPGDIAIVQVNFSQQSFDFVPLVDIAAGTKIKFTDYAWKNSLKAFDKTTQYDTEITYTAPANIAKGTVIQTKNNTAFDNNSVSFYSKNAGNTYLKGENLIAFQINGNDTVFVSAFGWMRKDNFSVNPANSLAKVCDIPPGLSKSDFTVIQMDSVVWGQNATLQRDFRYNKYDGFTGTASRIRFWLSNTSNYDTFSGYYNNDAVSNFTVNAPDLFAPALSYSYPSNNKANCSVYRSGIFNFNEQVFVKKSLILADNATNNTLKTFTVNDLKVQNDSIVSFDLYQLLEKAKTYKLIIPAGFVTDLDNNSWPATELIYIFATSANRSIVDIDFGDKLTQNTEVVKYFTRENIEWTTTGRFIEDNQNFCKGYFSWKMFGIPMRWYSNRAYVPTNTDIPHMGDVNSKIATKIWLSPSDRLVIDLTGVSNTVTDIYSEVYENYCFTNQKIYSGAQPIKTINVTGTNGAEKTKTAFENIGNSKIDSLVYTSLEGNASRIILEITDNQAPAVNLGNSRVVCEGDSVQLDAGLTLGALYTWNTGATTQKIWAKTTGTYSVTVKNSLGQASDNVQVTVKPVITLSMPDTITACVGDTITLTAGTNTENSYFWSPTGQTTPSIKVTKSGIYHVLVNNGFGGCFSTDSTRVIFKGAKLHAFHYQGGSYGAGDVVAELYRKNTEGKFNLYRTADMLQMVQFDSLASGEYILKSHFVNYSFVGENPWLDTYHDGKTEWKKVTPFSLSCTTDTMIGFMIASKPVFEFTGTAVISGKVEVIEKQHQAGSIRFAKHTTIDCETKVLLFDGSGNLIATTCPDSEGNYSFRNLPAGNYSIGIERTGFEIEHQFTTSITEGSTISNAHFTINENNQIIEQGLSTGHKVISDSNFCFDIFPNPMKGNGIINFESARTLETSISIIDFTGRILESHTIQVIVGKTSIPLIVNELHGIYLIKICNSEGMSVKRLIVE